jgi:hypothetical protein
MVLVIKNSYKYEENKISRKIIYYYFLPNPKLFPAYNGSSEIISLNKPGELLYKIKNRSFSLIISGKFEIIKVFIPSYETRFKTHFLTSILFNF